MSVEFDIDGKIGFNGCPANCRYVKPVLLVIFYINKYLKFDAEKK